MPKPSRSTVCLWFDAAAEEAARFYAAQPAPVGVEETRGGPAVT